VDVGADSFDGIGSFDAVTNPTGRKGAIKSPKEADWRKFETDEGFRLDHSPALADYLANQYRRFAGRDEVLQWDEFWRLISDLNLGLDDFAIAQLRQQVLSCASHGGVGRPLLPLTCLW
jgi:hypothetical protein